MEDVITNMFVSYYCGGQGWGYIRDCSKQTSNKSNYEYIQVTNNKITDSWLQKSKWLSKWLSCDG